MPRLLRALAVAALALAGLTGRGSRTARAEEAKGPSPADVRKAMDAGVDWLRAQFATGFRDEGTFELGELVTLTLIHAGAGAQDEVVKKGLAFLQRTAPRYTYRASLQAMALAEVNPKLYQERIAHCAQFLVDTQLSEGEWGYPGTVNGPGRMPNGVTVSPPPPEEGAEKPSYPRDKVKVVRQGGVTSDSVLRGDFSNTQFAILGLRACASAGVEAPASTWKAALAYLRKYQRPDGGWGYVVQGTQDEASYSSLTCAGVCSTAICLSALGTKDVASDAGIKKALAWLDKNLDPTRNAGADASSVMGPSTWQYYHLYSLERAGRVLGKETVGKRPWYAEGAAWLVARQQADGHWEDDATAVVGTRPRYLTPSETCFALLFLARATRPVTR
jgi:hypothetical protein